jgi:hypothetical protein
LLRDKNAEVREAAGLALAFSNQNSVTEILCPATRDSDKDVEANAIAASARVNPPDTDCLCAGLAHTQPQVRAQSVESLCELMGETGEDSKCPIDSIVERLADDGKFEGLLALEVESQRAGGFLRTKGLTSTTPARGQRSVAQITADHLSRMAGQTITPEAKLSPHLKSEICQKVRSGLRKNRMPAPGTTTMPAILNHLPWATSQP